MRELSLIILSFGASMLIRSVASLVFHTIQEKVK